MKPELATEIERLSALADMCRAKGIMQLQVGDIILAMGQDPTAVVNVPDDNPEGLSPGAMSLLYASSPAMFDTGRGA
jgi:hypothetical protein